MVECRMEQVQLAETALVICGGLQLEVMGPCLLDGTVQSPRMSRNWNCKTKEWQDIYGSGDARQKQLSVALLVW